MTLLKMGLSGIMRVKNEALFLERCVASCINALDELVIVYNDCTDGSEIIIKKLESAYPDKIRVYEYPHHIYGVGLSAEEYEIARNLPEDSPNLLCSYYNFALSKVTYQYAIKIDADQIYFSDVLEHYRNICKGTTSECPWSHRMLGWLFQFYLSAFRRISVETNQVIPLMPKSLAQSFSQIYRNYAIRQFLLGKACLSFSGLNVWEEGEKTYVSLGFKNDIFNILPPFNGEGDHVLFKVTPEVHFRRFEMPYYNNLRSTSYSIIEEFVHPYRIMPVGFLWKHINAQRPEYRNVVEQVRKAYPQKYMLLGDFFKASWRNIVLNSDINMFTIYQRALFSFVYKAYGQDLKKFLEC